MKNPSRSSYLKIPKKKKTPFLPFILFLLVILVIVYFFWHKKRDVNRINTAVQIENSQQSSYLTVVQDSLNTTADFDSMQIVSERQNIRESMGASELSSMTESDLNLFSDRYDNALRLFYTEQYNDAIRILADLKQKYPSHSFAVNCQYWTGECYFGLRDYNTALDAFQKVLVFGESNKSDDSIMMIGRCYYKLNDKINAKFYFNKLLLDFPKSEYVSKARLHLARL
ncbi:tetratricopeptide repeat protein [candidate division KSB1 bacterium]|nr:tetratricopeptide repeat protein [candidate division KSB1 bacterium]